MTDAPPPLLIAVDGPAASGKGTLSRRLATHYGLRHLDTGLTYRAVALALLDAGLALDDVKSLTSSFPDFIDLMRGLGAEIA